MIRLNLMFPAQKVTYYSDYSGLHGGKFQRQWVGGGAGSKQG